MVDSCDNAGQGTEQGIVLNILNWAHSKILTIGIGCIKYFNK